MGVYKLDTLFFNERGTLTPLKPMDFTILINYMSPFPGLVKDI